MQQWLRRVGPFFQHVRDAHSCARFERHCALVNLCPIDAEAFGNILCGLGRRHAFQSDFERVFIIACLVRGICGRGLMAMGHYGAFRLHALLLADPEPATRAMAVETLATVPDERAELLLRCKIGAGPDPRPLDIREYNVRDPEVGIELDAYEALMKVAPAESFDLLAGYLRDGTKDTKAVGNKGWAVDPPWLPPGSDYADPERRSPANRSGPDPRHNKRVNVAFCDGRVESMTLEDLGYFVKPDGSIAADNSTQAHNRKFSGTGNNDAPPKVN